MGIGQAYVNVECDKCGELSDGMELTSLAGGGWDARNIANKLKRDGWTVRDFGDTICPECSEPEQK
jgi:hypothetical protein